jgi:hypothetical protein
MQFFAGLEADSFAWSNGDLGPCAGIAADACLAWFDSEDTKAAQFDAITGDQSLLHALEDGVYRGFCLGSRQTGALNNPLYKILLNHLGRRPWAVIFENCC